MPTGLRRTLRTAAAVAAILAILLLWLQVGRGRTPPIGTRLTAPRKRLVWYEASAHFPFLEEPAKFAAEMNAIREEAEPR
jgi:pimeloyl-ACP methyl ester carboxylesterase